VPIVLKSGRLKLLEPSRPVQACNGIVLPLPDSKKMADPVYSSYNRCPPEIKTSVNMLEKNKKIIQKRGQNSVGYQGATSFQSLEALFCVASETLARGEVVICH